MSNQKLVMKSPSVADLTSGESSPPKPQKIMVNYICRGCKGVFEDWLDDNLCYNCYINAKRGLPEMLPQEQPYYPVLQAGEKQHLDRHFYGEVMTLLVEHQNRTHGANRELVEGIRKALDEL